LGWILTGSFFLGQSFNYQSHNDIVLTVICALVFPLSFAVARWEYQANPSHRSALAWARGTVAFAGLPYLFIMYIPWLSVLAIWFVASQSALFLSFATGINIELGTTYVNTPQGRIPWEEWTGNRWFSMDFAGEYPFQTELLLNDGTMIGINFVLACTALQSMVLFIGAISCLELNWKVRIRALLLTVPLIHLLNVFRNAGLIWMHLTYTTWSFQGLSVFEFGHSYVARFVSLFAMFFMALLMFEIVPEMHRHILTLTRVQPKEQKNTQ